MSDAVKNQSDDDQTAVTVLESDRLQNIKRALQNRGIALLTNDTPEGRVINDLLARVESIAHPTVPPIVRAMIAENIVSALLMSRSAMSFFLKHSSIPDGHSNQDRSIRQALQLAMQIFSKSNDSLVRNLRMLGLTAEESETKISSLNKLLDEIRSE